MTASNETLLGKVEQFLYQEAALLDSGKLGEWRDLFAADGVYLVPALHDHDASTQDALYIINDDPQRLTSRVKQLLNGSVWAEIPLSRTRRLITNIRILSTDAATVLVTSNFSLHRFRHSEQQVYVGRYEHRLSVVGEGFRILERSTYLDHETLRQGKLSIIV